MMTVEADWQDFASAVGGKYTAVSEIGCGAMAVVLRARDVRHDRDVALKVFRRDLSAAIASERFEREIQIAARLNHPHIIPLFDSGEAAGHLFYVMPFVLGETLRERLNQDGTLDVALALRLTAEVCGALDYAHRSGVVHRDIKPENVLLSEGHAVVADFGIAHALDRAGDIKLTALGLTLGTPAYMSPEQAAGNSVVDGRSDQYSLACVLFELLTGNPPFKAPTAMALIARHITEVAPLLSASRPDVSEALDSALERALEKQADDRFPTATDFARALESVGAFSVATGTLHESVAVLDFRNISGDPSVQWLSTGIAETIAVDLNRVESVRLVRREKLSRALARCKLSVDSDDDAVRIARSLGARWVIWGGYQYAGDRIRITPRFVDSHAKNDVTVVKLDGRMADVFQVQDQIIDAMLELLRVDASERERAEIAKPQTTVVSAYELYARARQLQNDFTPGAILQSRQLLLQATELDPQYALAHSGVGFSYAFGFIATSNPADLTNALRHLQRAIELDPGLGEAYAWLSYAYMRSGRADEAVEAGQRATELEPDFHFAHYFRGVALTSSSEFSAQRWGMRRQAVVSLLTAADLEPGSQSTYHILGDLYLSNGQYDDAAWAAKNALNVETGLGRTSIAFVGAYFLDALVAARRGDATLALKQFRHALDLYSTSKHMLASYCVANSLIGLGELARRRGAFDEALIHARRSEAFCRENATHVGTGYAIVRAHLLAAKASASLGVASEARAELRTAESLLRDKTGYAFSYGAEANEAQTRFEFASAYAASGKVDMAMHWLERAYDACWNDYPSIKSDPSFARMLALPVLEAFIDRCRARGNHPVSRALVES